MTTINRALCDGCKKPILWITNENGRNEPFDAKPTRMLRVAGDMDPSGHPNVFLEAGKVFEVQAGHINHFITCPVANRFREKAKEIPK